MESKILCLLVMLDLKNQVSEFPSELHFFFSLSTGREQFRRFLYYGKERVQRQSFAHPEQLLNDNDNELHLYGTFHPNNSTG